MQPVDSWRTKANNQVAFFFYTIAGRTKIRPAFDLSLTFLYAPTLNPASGLQSISCTKTNKKMKKIVTGILAFSAFIFAASAQETGKMKHHPHQRGHGMIMKSITLSDAQKEQMKSNWQSTKSQLAELNKNEDITVREYKAKKEAILKSQKEKMNNLLTQEQKDQLAKNKVERKAKFDLMSSKRLDKLKTSLNLSDDQFAKIKANREASQAKMKVIRENEQLSMSEKKEQLMALGKEQKENFKQVLTPDQISKMEEMKKGRMNRKDSK